MDKLYDIIIVGAGPAGIGAVVEAKHFGLKNILILEKMSESSNTIRKFYKDGKRVDRDWKGLDVPLKGHIPFEDSIKEATLEFFDSFLQDDEIEYLNNCNVEKVVKNDDIFIVNSSQGEFHTKNVVIGIGRMGKPNKPSYDIPHQIKRLVNFNLDKTSDGEKILVVGGGDSAVEYAYELASTGFDVMLNYRKKEFTRINPTNQNDLNKVLNNSSLKLKSGIDIIGLEEDDKKVKVNFTDDTSEVFDRVIYAIGGTTPIDFLKSCGIELDGKVPVMDESHQTNIKGLYVSGDITFKNGGSVSTALNQSYDIVEHILK